MIRYIILSFLIFGLLISVSCNQKSRPDGMPELYPFSIKILQEGQPLVEANVVLHPEDKALSRWPCGAYTNAEGIAEFRTYGSHSGAPAGKFKVVVQKVVTEGGNRSDDPKDIMSNPNATEASKSFNLVDAQYQTAESTPFSVEVKPGKNREIPEFDVGAAVHEPVQGVM
ncbi:MAG: carboxypeptidase regulatory-like domain-containing protein [Planctomycetia bacterium]|nr:carboxypeptidase regulatory-like domain-containing protein [Planctomycetia bacterium]